MKNQFPLVVRRRPTKFRVNWEQIKNAYIFAEPILHEETKSIRYPSLEDIANQYNVSITTISAKSQNSKPTWYEMRKMYHEKIRKLHELEYGVMQMRRSSEFDSHNLARLDKFSKIFDVWLDDLEDAIKNKNAYREEEEPIERLGIRDMKEAMSVMKDMHKLNRDILGEPVNYYEFYKEKLKDEQREVEKGKAVTRDEIRELITAVRQDDASRTLDLNIAEELGLKTITISDEVEDDAK